MKKLQNNQIESIVLKDGTIANIEKVEKLIFLVRFYLKKYIVIGCLFLIQKKKQLK